MQYTLRFDRRSEEEYIKDQGLVLDYDEIARKGKMSKEEGLISKWYGVYGSRQPGDHMARVVVPGGRLTSAQARKIVEAADKYAPGLISITTRQALQLHRLQVGALADLMRDLASEGLTTFHGCGDVVRNVAACPLAETCRYRRADVLPHALSAARYLSACRDLDNLPRKFKITFSGCSAGCAQPYMNCVGVVAVTREHAGERQTGFRIVIGGGMGWKAFVAQELFGFVPEHEINDYLRALVLLYRDHGDRYNRATSRLKFVVDRLGIERCREIVREKLVLEGKTAENGVAGPVADVGVPYPPRPLTEEDPVGDDGTVAVRIIVPKGELSSAQLLRVAELSERFGNQRVYTDNRQNLALQRVAPDRVAALKEEIHRIGFKTEGFFGLTDPVCCVGSTYCPKAVTETRALFDLLLPVLEEPRYREIRARGFVNITGCPNSCSPYRIADLGFRGTRIRELSGSVEGYEVLVAGSEQEHGAKLGDFKVEDCPALVRGILDLFLAQSQPGETLGDFARRWGIERLRATFPAPGYRKAPAPVELSLPQGAAATATDFRSQQVSVPCQAACPAGTDVPGYIELIAKGRFAEAYRINLEDNVFPAVLGRVCVRPCQKECRHTWSDINGTVEICSLKRAAADRGAHEVGPLPPLFPLSPYRVAVVGGGPAGLAAARELRRFGHEVTLFEKEPQLGGMLVHGIPRFRLPLAEIEREIGLITRTGIKVRTGETVDREEVQRLVSEHDAVLLATGTVRPNLVDIEGLTPGLFSTGLDFMKRYNHGAVRSLKGDVVIIGGGFTAVDTARSSARTARKLLGDNGSVTVAYRRSEQYLAADQVELEEMERERISVRTLLTPVAVRLEKGRLAAIRLRRNYLGPHGEGGKPEITPVPDSEFEIPCRHLVVATGQSQDWSILPEGVKLTGEYRTSHDRIFCAGDFQNGSLDVITAVADGKKAAALMDARLTGTTRVQRRLAIAPALADGETGRYRQHDLQDPLPMRHVDLEGRTPSREVALGFDEAQTKVHATRCYLCHYKLEIDQDTCIHCNWCIDVTPRNCIHQVASFDADADGVIVKANPAGTPREATFIWIDSKNCIRCGKCLRVCPVQAISMRKTTLVDCPVQEAAPSGPDCRSGASAGDLGAVP